MQYKVQGIDEGGLFGWVKAFVGLQNVLTVVRILAKMFHPHAQGATSVRAGTRKFVAAVLE